MKDVSISSDLALTLVSLLRCTIEYDDAGEPIDSDHSFWYEALLDLEEAIKRS